MCVDFFSDGVVIIALRHLHSVVVYNSHTDLTSSSSSVRPLSIIVNSHKDNNSEDTLLSKDAILPSRHSTRRLHYSVSTSHLRPLEPFQLLSASTEWNDDDRGRKTLRATGGRLKGREDQESRIIRITLLLLLLFRGISSDRAPAIRSNRQQWRENMDPDSKVDQLVTPIVKCGKCCSTDDRLTDHCSVIM